MGWQPEDKDVSEDRGAPASNGLAVARLLIGKLSEAAHQVALLLLAAEDVLRGKRLLLVNVRGGLLFGRREGLLAERD